MIVNAEHGQAVGTVVHSVRPIEEKRRPAADSSQRVVRLATRDDIVAR